MRFLSCLVLAAAVLSAPAFAQVASSPDTQGDANAKAMQNMLNMQRIPVRAYRDNSTITCKEQPFLSCNAGYSCSAIEPNGRTSNIEIIGKQNAHCHVQTSQPGGTTAQCRYSDDTMQQLYWLYQQESIGLGDALALGQRVMNECEMYDAQGNALGKPVVNPGTIQ